MAAVPSGRSQGVVDAVDLVTGELLEQAVAQHLGSTGEALLGRLEDQVDGAGEVARLGEVARGAEQHGGVAVMAAGMHAVLVGALVGQVIVELGHGQSVHVGAQADLPVAGPAMDHAHDAGLAEAAMHLDAPGFQLLGDDAGGANLLEADLRMGMEVAPPFRHLGMELGDAVDDGHGIPRKRATDDGRRLSTRSANANGPAAAQPCAPQQRRKVR